MSDPRRDIPEQIKRHFFRKAVEARGLLGLGPDSSPLHRGAGSYVDKISTGRNLPMSRMAQLTEYDLVINLKTAKTLGLTIPPSLQLRADQVIE